MKKFYGLIFIFTFITFFIISCSSKKENENKKVPDAENVRISKVYPVDLAVDDGGNIKFKIKNERKSSIEILSIKILGQGDIFHDIIEASSLSKEYSLMRYKLKDLKIEDQYRFKIEIYYSDLTDLYNVKNHSSISIVSGKIIEKHM